MADAVQHRAAELRGVKRDLHRAHRDGVKHSDILYFERTRYNLRCAEGHLHWSPTPELFDGRDCLRPLRMINEGLASERHRCHAVMLRLDARPAVRPPV